MSIVLMLGVILASTSYALPAAAASPLVYSTDFENVVQKDPSHLNMGSINDYFEFGGNGGAAMWMEGLDRNTPGIACHSGSRCVGMELTNIIQSRRNEFNIHGLQNLVGGEVFVSVWLYLPADWQLHFYSAGATPWYEIVNPYFTGGPTYAPYTAVHIKQPDTTKDIFNLDLDGRDISQVQHNYGHIANYQLPRGRWFNVQYYVYRDVTNGIIKVWIDGTLLLSMTNLQTQNTSIAEWYTTIAKIYYDSTDTYSPYRLWVDDLEMYNTLPSIASTSTNTSSAATSTSSPTTSSATSFTVATSTMTSSQPTITSTTTTSTTTSATTTTSSTTTSSIAPVTSTTSSSPPANTGVVLFLGMDGSNQSTSFIDSSASGHTMTAHGGAEIVTNNEVSGSGSGYLPSATGSYLTTPDSNDWYFGTGDFTIDCWVKFNTLPSTTYVTIVGSYNARSGVRWYYSLLNTGGVNTWNFRAYNGSSWTIQVQSGSATVTTGTWYHIALARSGNSWYFFQNGTQVGTTKTNSNAVPYTATTLEIGDFLGGYHIDGWMDELRVTKGVALWTSSFTPPTSYPSPTTSTSATITTISSSTTTITTTSTTTSSTSSSTTVSTTATTATSSASAKGPYSIAATVKLARAKPITVTAYLYNGGTLIASQSFTYKARTSYTFAFTGLTAGTYTVTVRANAVPDQSKTVTIPSNAQVTFTI